VSTSTLSLNRRNFLKTGLVGATGLVVGFYLPGRRELLAETPTGPGVLNAFIRVSPENTVTIYISKSEMGQGVVTSLSMLAAEELECDWQGIKWEFAPADKVYFDPSFGMQGTGGSQTIHSGWIPMRTAGATARIMLIAAAAQKWGVDPSECYAEDSKVFHRSTKRSVTYGSVAEAAGKLPQPALQPGVTDEKFKLKDPSQFKIIGKPTKRLDTAIKVNGKAEFGIDVRRPGMLHAAVLRCPVFGGKVASFDATKAKQLPGVKDVVQISTGVAVIADNTWTAFEGRRALDVKWDEGPNANVSNDSIFKSFEEKMPNPGVVAKKEGDADAAMGSAAQKVEATYQAPYEAHATMEPMNCVAHVQSDRVDVWAPTQFQTPSQGIAAGIAGLKPEQSFVHTTYLGGGFGRRGWSDFVTEACETSKAMKAPVQVTWTREDDMQHDYYRPASLIKMSAGLDANGNPVAFKARVACDSIMNWFFPGSIKNGLDSSSVEGVADLPYDVPNILVDYHLVSGPIPQGFWRSVGASQNGFFSESFVDELAYAAKKDPYEYRKALLAKQPRHLGVLNMAAEKADWGKPLPQGVYRGIAVLEAFSTYVAEVAEVSVDKDKNVKVHRIVCAFDCGQAVNPWILQQQAEGAIVFGLTQTLKNEITIDKGRVQQSNFSDYDMLRMNECPKIEVYNVPSKETPTGMGEPAVPPVAPAVCNAVFAATGKRIRRLPIHPEDLA
jgi:isoquinoline 1-oxidoreductase subunit beta